MIYSHRKHDLLNFPYDFPFDNNYAWDSAVGWKGLRDANGLRDEELTQLACHYIKNYGFWITDDNPRVKDFDTIVTLCHERGWNLVFNLMAENVDKANELVGKDLMFLIKRNRDYLLDRYGNTDGVKVVDNLNLVRDVNFIDQDWTTEHYYEEGRRIIAHHLAQTLKQYYPDDYQDLGMLKYDVGHYYFDGLERELSAGRPYSAALILTSDSLRPDWSRVNVAFEIKQQDDLGKPIFAVEKHSAQGEVAIDSYEVKPQVQKTGAWDFATFALPLDSAFCTAQKIKLYVHNFSESPVWVKNLDVSFRPAYLKPRVKAQSSRSD